MTRITKIHTPPDDEPSGERGTRSPKIQDQTRRLLLFLLIILGLIIVLAIVGPLAGGERTDLLLSI
jgi:hypothetical protein